MYTGSDGTSHWVTCTVMLLASRDDARSISQRPSPLPAAQGGSHKADWSSSRTHDLGQAAGLLVGRSTVCQKVLCVGTELSFVPFSLKSNGPLSFGKPVMLLLLASPPLFISVSFLECDTFQV